MTEVEAHEGLVSMRLTLARLGASMPPVPDVFVPALKDMGANMFATRDLPAPLYDATEYIEEWFSGDAPDYLAVGVDGYGMFNHYFHYYLVRDGVAVFLQSPIINEDGMEGPVAGLNAKIDRLEAALDSMLKTSTTVVDVIGAQYIAHGAGGEGGADMVVHPFEHLLASPGVGDGHVAMIRA